MTQVIRIADSSVINKNHYGFVFTIGCIFVNRDKNACKNILYLGKYFLEYQLRPKEFSPKPKENNIIKQRKTRQKKEIVV